MLGQLVARLWEALEKPRTTPDRVETLLKASSATEMDAGIWLAVHALAGAVGDTETLRLAATRHRQEREFADWIRERLTWIAHGAAPQVVLPSGESNRSVVWRVAGAEPPRHRHCPGYRH